MASTTRTGKFAHMSDRDYVLHLVDKASNSKDAKRNNWLGCPIANLADMPWDDALQALLREGVLEIAERPGTINPARKAVYIRRVNH